VHEDRVTVSDADIRAARLAWEASSAADPGSPRTTVLRDSYRRLVSAQAQQLADDVRRRRSEG